MGAGVGVLISWGEACIRKEGPQILGLRVTARLKVGGRKVPCRRVSFTLGDDGERAGSDWGSRGTAE